MSGSPGKKWLNLEEIANNVIMVFSRAPWCPVYEEKSPAHGLLGKLFSARYPRVGSKRDFFDFFRVFTVPEKPVHQNFSPKVQALDFFSRIQDTKAL